MAVGSPVDALVAGAERVRGQLGLVAFDAAAVGHLARFIEGQRGALPAGQREAVATALGCFLGQCLVAVYGGEWATGPDGSTGVGLAERFFFNPFHLVNQQLNEGESASVAAFFAGVPQRLAAPVAVRKRWIS